MEEVGFSYATRIRQVIAAGLPRGEARASSVARHLGLNRRTLHAQLSRVGLNHSSLLQSVRCDLSTQYLSSNRSITEIAGLVGFESLSAFTRWFRSAFACTPSSWRLARKGCDSFAPSHRRETRPPEGFPADPRR